MRPVATTTSAAPPDPVRAALADEAILARLRASACVLTASNRVLPPEDAVQETAMRAIKHAGQYDPARAAVGAWLHGILVNVVKDAGRQQGRRPVQLADETLYERLAVALAPPHDGVAACLDLADYLRRLPAEQQAILQLRYRDDLDGEALAGRLGCSVGAARVRLCRALAALRTLVTTLEQEDGR